jgi:hypothetical protein
MNTSLLEYIATPRRQNSDSTFQLTNYDRGFYRTFMLSDAPSAIANHQSYLPAPCRPYQRNDFDYDVVLLHYTKS